MKIGWVIDFPIEGSGGHKTWFYYINDLIKRKHVVDVYVRRIDGRTYSSNELKEITQKLLKIETDAHFIYGWDISGHYDILFATWYKTASFVANYPLADHKLYFIQDYEPWFNPMNSEFLEADQSYRLGLTGITMGRWLAGKLGNEYGMDVWKLFLGADSSLYRDFGKERKSAVCFIYQDDKPRRCPELGVAALQYIQSVRPDIQIVTYGSNNSPPIEGVLHLGLVDYKRLPDLYNSCLVGICLSSSNPSRIPFEMMSCGLPVVELHRENNLYDLPETGALLAQPSAEAIGSAVIELFDNDEKWKRLSDGGKEFMKSHTLSSSVSEFSDILRKIKSGVSSEGPASIIYKESAFKANPDYTAKHHDFRQFKTRNGVPLTIFDLRYSPVPRYLPSRAMNLFRVLYARVSNLLKYIMTRSFVYYRFCLRPISPTGILKDIKSSMLLYLRALRSQSITSDIFDTVVYRKSHADHPKIASAQYLLREYPEMVRGETRWQDVFSARRIIEKEIADESQEAGLDDEYGLHEVLLRLVRKFTNRKTEKEYEIITRDLERYECEFDTRLMYLSPRFMTFYRYFWRKIKGFVSDVYYTVDQVSALLRQSGFENVSERCVLSSAEYKLNKKSGRLFGIVKRRLRLNKKTWLHIGDSKAADIWGARNASVKCSEFFDSGRASEKRRQDVVLRHRLSGNYVSLLLVMKELVRRVPVPKSLNRKQKQLYKFGLETAPLFLGFALFLVDNLRRSGHSDVYFCTREGVFFRKIYERTAKLLRGRFSVPRSHILRVSRLSTFSASIGKVDLKGFSSLWTQYGNQTVRAFFKSLGVNVRDYQKWIRLVSGRERKRGRITENESFMKLFTNQVFLDQLQEDLDQKRASLLGYLEHIGFLAGRSSALVDIGWKGSIQDNLARLLPDREISGFYLGLTGCVNPPPINARKYGYLLDHRIDPVKDIGLLWNHESVVEMLCNGDSGSAVGYEKRGTSFEALMNNDRHEDSVFYEFVQHYQKGVLDGVSELMEYVVENAVASDELRGIGYFILSQLIQNPQKVLSEAFFKLKHNETFGVGKFDDKSTEVSLFRNRRLVSPLVLASRKRRQIILSNAEKSTWKEGFLAYLGLGWISCYKRVRARIKTLV